MPWVFVLIWQVAPVSATKIEGSCSLWGLNTLASAAQQACSCSCWSTVPVAFSNVSSVALSSESTLPLLELESNSIPSEYKLVQSPLLCPWMEQVLKHVEVRYDVPGNDDVTCNRDHSRDVRSVNEADVDNRIQLPK